MKKLKAPYNSTCAPLSQLQWLYVHDYSYATPQFVVCNIIFFSFSFSGITSLAYS